MQWFRTLTFNYNCIFVTYDISVNITVRLQFYIYNPVKKYEHIAAKRQLFADDCILRVGYEYTHEIMIICTTDAQQLATKHFGMIWLNKSGGSITSR